MNVLFITDEIIKTESVDNIVLYGGANVPFFSVTSAEGEGKPKLYRREWTMNYVIYHCFNDRIQFSWKHKESEIKIRFYAWFRELWLSTVYLLSQLKHAFKACLMNKNYKEIGVGRYNLYLCPLKLQYRHLERISQESTIGAYFISSSQEDATFNLPDVGLSRLLSVISKTKVVVRESTLQMNKFNASIKMGRSFIRSLRLPLLKYHAELERYLILNEKTHLIENAEKLINNKTIGADAYLDADLAERFRKELLTFQYVSLDMSDFPCHKVWKHIYLYTQQHVDFFRSKGFDANVYKEPKLKKISRNDGLINVSLFLQPDAYNEYSLKASLQLARLITMNDKYRLFIKPHYRQTNVEEIKSALNGDTSIKQDTVSVLGNEESVNSILSYTDICVGFSSSVLSESINADVPTVSIVADKYIRDYLNDNETLSRYCWMVDGFNDVSDILDKSDLIINHFYTLKKEAKEIGFEVRDIIE